MVESLCLTTSNLLPGTQLATAIATLPFTRFLFASGMVLLGIVSCYHRQCKQLSWCFSHDLILSLLVSLVVLKIGGLLL